MTAVSPSAPRGIRGRHVLGAMIAFFAVIVVADATMIYKALTTFGGVDNSNAYREGLAYNDRISRAKRQASRGWGDAVTLCNTGTRLRVAMTAADGKPLAGLRVEATLGRPATARADMTLALAEAAPGVYEAPVPAPLAEGTWIAGVRAIAGDGDGDLATPDYQTRRRLWVAP